MVDAAANRVGLCVGVSTWMTGSDSLAELCKCMTPAADVLGVCYLDVFSAADFLSSRPWLEYG